MVDPKIITIDTNAFCWQYRIVIKMSDEQQSLITEEQGKALEQTAQEKDWQYEDVIALFFQQHEKSLPYPISKLGLRELRRVVLYALFGELGNKSYNPKTDHERKLGYGIRQAFAERTIMEAVQQEIEIAKHKSKLEPIVSASEAIEKAKEETSQTNIQGE